MLGKALLDLKYQNVWVSILYGGCMSCYIELMPKENKLNNYQYHPGVMAKMIN